jgi:hypothetical protein
MSGEGFQDVGGLYGNPNIAFSSRYPPGADRWYGPRMRNGRAIPYWSSNLAYADFHLYNQMSPEDPADSRLRGQAIPVWASQPLVARVPRDGRRHTPPARIHSDLPGGNVVIWQYGRGILSSGSWLVDLNVAKPEAFEQMWAVPAATTSSESRVR